MKTLGYSLNYKYFVENIEKIKNYSTICLFFNGYSPNLSEVINIKELVRQKKIVLYGHSLININFCTPTNFLRRLYIDKFINELIMFREIGVITTVFHPGSTKKIISSEEGIKNLIICLKEIINILNNTLPGIRILVENMSGEGGKILNTIEEIKYFFNLYDQVNLCFDTCHAFVAGYQLNNKDVVQYIENEIGNKIKLLHINDSKFELNSKKDRHEAINKGYLKDFFNKGYINIFSAQTGLLETPFIDIIEYEKEMKYIYDAI